MQSFEQIVPGRTDRAIVIGMTGSGKTTLVKQLLAKREYVVIHDAKGNISIPGYIRVTTLAECVEVGRKAAKIIYAPTHEELDLTRPEAFVKMDNFFRWLYERKNTTIYVDEVYSVVKGRIIPHYYHALLTRGRELNLSVISSTQRPKDIPQVVMSEAEHYYVFKLRLPQDKQKVKEILGLNTEQIQALNKREFYYGNAEGDIIGPLKLKL